MLGGVKENIRDDWSFVRVEHSFSGTVTLIEKCSGAVEFEAVATEHVGSFTFQAAASGAVT